MSRTNIAADLRRLVLRRAEYRCEYCQLPQSMSFAPHEVDRITERQLLLAADVLEVTAD